MAAFDAPMVYAASAALTLDDFRKSYAVGGIDLSQTTDLTAASVIIERAGKLYAFCQFFMPANRVEAATAIDGVPYEIFVKRGFVTLSGENHVQYKDVFNWFKRLKEEYKIYVLKVGYDRYSAQYLVDDMKGYGFYMDDVWAKAAADHGHDDRYALIGHTHSGGGASVECKTITVPLDGRDAGVPCTQTISVAGVATTDYISAKYTSNAINTNERVADHAAYCCVSDGTPTPGGVLLTCWHARPTRDIRMILRVEHGGTTGYMVLTGQAAPSSGTKTANGSVITAEQTITVTGLGFRPSMVSFIGSSGKTTITSGHGVDTGSTTAAWYADASGPGNIGTFSPSNDGFVLTVQGMETKTLNVGWQAVGD